MRKLQNDAAGGQLAEPATVTVGQYLDSWLKDTAKSNVQPDHVCTVRITGQESDQAAHRRHQTPGREDSNLRPPEPHYQVRGRFQSPNSTSASLLKTYRFHSSHSLRGSERKINDLPTFSMLFPAQACPLLAAHFVAEFLRNWRCLLTSLGDGAEKLPWYTAQPKLTRRAWSRLLAKGWNPTASRLCGCGNRLNL